MKEQIDPSQVPEVPDDARHEPILVNELIAHLKLKPDARVIDATLGLGGHAQAILDLIPQGKLLGIDRDIESLALARDRLAPFGSRISLVHGNFADLRLLVPQEFQPADAIIMDLGLSSWQLAARGFSFKRPAPVDFRMDRRSEQTAAELVNNLPERDLADLIYQYGEEHRSRRIAAAIVAERAVNPIETTTQLAEIISRAVGRRTKLHPATKTFQALRIVINDELTSLERGLAAAEELLRRQGRLAVVTFHSLEDRIVKQHIKESAHLNKVNKKVIQASRPEIIGNPRARSAKLRIAEKN